MNHHDPISAIHGRWLVAFCALLLAGLFAGPVHAQPQVAFYNAAPITLSNDFSGPAGLALDASGKIYVADNDDKSVKMMSASCATGSSCTVTTLSSVFGAPTGVAVDASGNIYVADLFSSTVQVIPASCAAGGSCAVTSLGGGFSQLQGVAVDAGGNIYVADGNGAETMPPGCASSSCVTSLGGDFNAATGIAVDASGNVYVADYGAVKTMSASCTATDYDNGQCTVTPLNGVPPEPYNVAVDASGNIYVTYWSDGSGVIVIPANCSSADCVMTLDGSFDFNYPKGIAVDASGNIYVARTNPTPGNDVLKLTTGAPSLNFDSTVVGATSADSPQSVPITNISNQPLTLPALPVGFTFDATSDCPVAPGVLAAGASCTLAIDFTPTATGNVTGSYALTSTQVMRLSGDADAAPPDPPGPTAILVPIDARWMLALIGALLAGVGAGVVRSLPRR